MTREQARRFKAFSEDVAEELVGEMMERLADLSREIGDDLGQSKADEFVRIVSKNVAKRLTASR